MSITRRDWIRQSLLASATMLVAGPHVAQGCASERPDEILGKDDFILLNWNENPYGPSEVAKQAVGDAMKYANRYPDEKINELKEKLAKKNGLKPANFLLTAGSTEVLSLLGQHVGLQRGEVLTPFPTFPTALRFGERAGATIKKVELDANDRIDLDQTLGAISDKTTMVFICNPNNPTGTELETEDLKAFCRKVPENVLIFVDEAYVEYSNAGMKGSMVDLVNELPNLVICRTFSKAYGLAGLRMGYAISNVRNIQALRDRHLGAEISTGWPPLVAASASLDDPEFINTCVAKNAEGKQIVYDAYDRWGVKYNPSSTNFVYARDDRFEKDLVAKMRAKGILITKWPTMTDHFRVSIGKPEHMRMYVKTVEEFLV
ncbi:histidinol-phosphate transaminase [Ekhidna sp.]|jgi:histidinol-phosphate aminotransferase|uniref:pyridoxal phosphate-dependent aminotransferase n=1 Tax=Ekhidna sp. TaxID=2608089 RepID=UPI0032EBA4BD